MGIRRKILDLLNHFDILNEETGELYLRRYYLFPPVERNRGIWQKVPFGIKLHEIRKSDRGRELHDHPWPFLSVILAGGYWENTPGSSTRDFITKWHRPGSIIKHAATDAHRLLLEEGKGTTWTLVVTGPKERTWGFHCEEGWVPWFEYVETDDYV